MDIKVKWRANMENLAGTTCMDISKKGVSASAESLQDSSMQSKVLDMARLSLRVVIHDQSSLIAEEVSNVVAGYRKPYASQGDGIQEQR